MICLSIMCLSFYYFSARAFPAKQIAPRASWQSLISVFSSHLSLPTTAHYSPLPASQAIKLGKTGIILNNS